MSFKVADEKLLSTDGDVARFPHVIATIEPTNQLARLGDHEHGGRNGIHGHDVARGSNGQSSYDVDVTDRDLAYEMTCVQRSKGMV